MDKIPYWKDLTNTTKNELIFNMEREEHQVGSYLCRKGEKADKLFLIQSGHVDIMTTYDAKQLPFIIERLERGSIINHRSFMVEDDIDTDYLCKDKVSVFVLSTQLVLNVMKSRRDLSKVFESVEKEVLLMKEEIAVDYIFHNLNFGNYT